jgi:outer membrane protein assembly factor BamD
MRFKLRVPILLLMFSAPFTGIVSCKDIPITEMSQDDGLAKIKKCHDDKDWAQVTSLVDEYKNRYPYSKYIKEAELMQADSYYQLQKYPETISVYENFIKRNPSDTNVGLADYRIAKSFDAQAPNNVDRDQSNSQKALEKYTEFIARFSNSNKDWLADSTDRKNSLEHRIANHDLFVAEFYWSRDDYAAALNRYLKIIKNYPNQIELVKNSRQKASNCYLKLSEMLKENPNSDKYIYFKDATPDSLAKNAQDVLQN